MVKTSINEFLNINKNITENSVLKKAARKGWERRDGRTNKGHIEPKL